MMHSVQEAASGRLLGVSWSAASDRRTGHRGEPLAPEQLLRQQIEATARQLAEARQDLISARRRVAQLQEAERNWLRLAEELRRTAQECSA
jgi:hypothetical protein